MVAKVVQASISTLFSRFFQIPAPGLHNNCYSTFPKNLTSSVEMEKLCLRLKREAGFVFFMFMAALSTYSSSFSSRLKANLFSADMPIDWPPSRPRRPVASWREVWVLDTQTTMFYYLLYNRFSSCHSTIIYVALFSCILLQMKNFSLYLSEKYFIWDLVLHCLPLFWAAYVQSWTAKWLILNW